MAKNFWENDDIVQPSKPQPWEADSVVKPSNIVQLEEATKKYEEEVPFLQRITDPIRQGIAGLPGMLPGIEVSAIQKQINAIREGKGGPRDPVTGESLPFQPEEAEAAIKMLQERQAEAQKKVMAANVEASKFQTRPAVQALDQVKGAREAWETFQVDPLGVMSSVSLQSLPQIAPALVLGAVTRNPTVGALAMGSTSFAGELSSGVMEYFQDKGVNISDPIAVNKALNDPKLFAEAYNHALTRGSIIGPLDAAAAGLASKMLVPKNVVKSQFAKEALNIGVAQPTAQMISGGGGEALAQLASEGEISKFGRVISEMAGEIPSSVAETAAFGGRDIYGRLKGEAPVAPPMPTGAPPAQRPAVEPTILTEPPTSITEADLEQIQAPPKQVTPTPMLVETAGLPPEVADQVNALQAEFQAIEQRKFDPLLTEEEAEIFQDRQGQIQQAISQLITPQAPAAAPAVEVSESAISPASAFAEEIASILQQRNPRFNLGSDYIYNAEFTVNKFARENPEQALGISKELAANPDLYSDQTGLPPGRIKSIAKQLDTVATEATEAIAPVSEEVVREPEVAEVPAEEPIDLKSEQAFRIRGAIEEIEKDPAKLTARNVNPLAKELDLEIGATPQETLNTVKQTLGMPVTEAPAAPALTQAEINRQRQAEKKAKAAASEEEKIVDAIREMAYDKDMRPVKSTANDFIEKYGKNMFDRAVELDLLDNEPGEGRLFPSNKYAYEVQPRYYDYKTGKKLAQPKEEKPAEEVKTQAEENQERQKKAKAKKDLDDAIYDLAQLVGKGTRLNMMPQEDIEQKLMPILTRLMDAAFRLGYYKFKDAARYVRNYIREKLGDDVADNITLDHLQGAYIGMAGKYEGASTKQEVIAVDSLADLEEKDSLSNPDTKFKIAEDISKYFLDGKEFKDIVEARKFITNTTKQKIEPGTAEAKEADEVIEVGIVLAAQQIAKGENAYDNLVDLYNRQPNLTVRTSTSMKEQAYSTPAPLAYVASQLAGINNNTTVYEPTAGNGMLLIDANPNKVIANELNAARYEMLQKVMDGATINNENAVQLDVAKEFDAVIANPPFGVVKDREGKSISYDVDGFKTNEIDHAIALKALGNMKEDGRAVLIVGGVRGESEEARREGYRSSAKRNFYKNLYDKYNVVDHFTVSGDLYKKQGAAYPVDVIVIAGKQPSARKLPAADLPKVYSSYEQLKEKLDEASRMESRPIGVTRPDIGAGKARPGERELLDTGVVVPSAAAGEKGGKPTGGVKEGVPTAPITDRTEAKPSGADISGKEPTTKDISELQRPEQKPVPSTGEGVEPRVGGVPEGGKPTGLGGPSVTADERVKPFIKEEETQYQITYIPKSKLKSVETLMPKGMADAIKRSLDRLENKVGDIDAYVAKSLQMNLATLGNYFSAEQVDALALSIDNAEKGKGFIIGDQTGIGKGRVVAAMIKYAIVNDKIPIFVTEKTNLYADMIRDLDAIGMSDFLNLEGDKQKVLITNASSKDKVPYTFIKDENGEKVEKNYILQSPKKGKNMGKLLDAMVEDNSIGNYKVIFTTYDQMKTVKKGATTPRREFLRHFAKDNYVILDESHNAGGTGTPDPKKENVAKFARGLINTSFGSFFSSATYAKRANVMDLYASTDMSLAVDNIEELADAIQNGGVPMQQVVATMLAEAGQYIRREKSFEGITYETKEVAIDKTIAENMATTLRSVLAFSSAKESVVDQIQEEEDESGGILVGGDRIKSEVEGDNFSATMHNLIGQMLLGLKAEEAANYAIERLKKGEKVVLTVSNTMGSFLNEFAADMGIKKGDPVDLSFKDLFIKYLNKQRIVKIKNEFGEPPEFIDGVKEVYLTDDMLGPKLTKLFNDIKEQIETADYGTAPISPIDYMQAIIRKAGYKTAEITGRNLVIDYSTPALILDTRDSGIMERLNSIKEFNNSDLNVMTLNRAGSTGLSLHSSQDFKNQDKRHMIIVQADADIAVHMQMLGRVNRTGQVNKPAYTQLGGDIPAENRPMAVLAKKMASLNANTTAGQKSAVTAENVVDFVNDYGGQVAQEFLIDNPWFNETIGNRIQIKEEASKGTDEDIRKLTGFIPVFPIKQQEEIYQDLLDRYASLIDSVNSMGVNKLEAKAMDLDAKILSSKQITEDKGEDSPFARPAYMEQLDVKRTVKPFTSKEVDELVQKNLNGRQAYEIARNLKSELRAKVAEFISSKKKEMLEKDTDPVTINKFEKQTELTESHVDTILDNYRIGDSISIKNPEGLFTYGVITDIFTKGKSVNPAAASAWKMQIALANGESRSLNLSFSQIGGLNGFTLEKEDVVDYINMQTGEGQRMRISEIFDSGSVERREKRWMVTGNLLAGYAQYPGQIVFYKKSDGTVAQGILQSRTFDFEKSEKEAPVKLKTAENVMQFLEINGAIVGTKDNVLQVSQRNGMYSFTVPRSKRVSGAYLNDDRLMAIGIIFTSRGKEMIYNSYDKNKVQAAFDYLIKERQNTILAIRPLDKAREMFAPKVAPEEFVGIAAKEPETRRDEVRAEKIKRRAELSRGISAIQRKIIKGNIDINVQRELTFLDEAKKAITKDIQRTKQPRVSAEDVRAKAAADRAAKRIDEDAYRVIEALTNRYPAVLDGLTLSVKQPKVAGVAGNFEPIQRIVTLYKGIATDKTMRHEITHSLEQMMTPEAQVAVVNAWANSLQKAIEKTDDKPTQDYFEAVFNYLQNPTEANLRNATNKMPDIKLYQFISPSEYWAVNAEPLLKMQLGGGWQRFKKAVQRLLETIKDILGFDNRRAIHREFDRIMSGTQERITKKMLVEYVTDNEDALKFLNSVEEFDKRFDEDGFANTPVIPSRTTKDLFLGAAKTAKQAFKDVMNRGSMPSPAMSGKLFRAITYVRNKYVFSGAGLEQADIDRQISRGLDGMLQDGNRMANASYAHNNAIYNAEVGLQVAVRGALAFDGQHQAFRAIERPFSMANVVLAKFELIGRVGLQRATNMVNKFFEAKRSLSIKSDFKARTKELEKLNEEIRDPKISAERRAALLEEVLQAEKGLRQINIAMKKVRMTDEQIEYYGNLDKENPELRTMLDNWTKVNENMIDMMLFGKIISKKRAEQLKKIKDYVPWYRLRDDALDPHDKPKMMAPRGLRAAAERRFEDSIVTSDIDDIVDNMFHNVFMITRNVMNNYAANRIAQEYATRNPKGQIAVFPEAGIDPVTKAVRVAILINGRSVIIEIKDPLIAEAVLGLENMAFPAFKMLSYFANGLRRGITLWPEFQVRQLFMDAPTAAIVTGLNNPHKVWADTFKGFVKSLKSDDPIVDLLKSFGVGGYVSYMRTPEIELQKKIGLMEQGKLAKLLDTLDRISDASDIAQRYSAYTNTLDKTGNHLLALYQASNVINWKRRGSSATAQFLSRTIAFMGAYAQQIDVLAMTLARRRFVGKSRGQAAAQLLKTVGIFSFYVWLYTLAVSDDDDYQELDDQTKIRNIFIPKDLTQYIGMDKPLLLPMHTSASFLFKSMPELITNYVATQGTKNEVDRTRLFASIGSGLVDSVLGPTPIPSFVKPVAEIVLDRNFFTDRSITPRGMEDLDAAQQYMASTSQLGKFISYLTGIPFSESIDRATGLDTSKYRFLNPIEADHLVRGWLGTTGAAAQWLVNLFAQERPSPMDRQNPLYGQFMAPEVGRSNEDLFYKLKEKVDNRYETYMKFIERQQYEQAEEYFDKHEKLISARGYISGMEASLRNINRQIRAIGEAAGKDLTKEERKQEIINLQRTKQEILDNIPEMRKEFGL